MKLPRKSGYLINRKLTKKENAPKTGFDIRKDVCPYCVQLHTNCNCKYK